MKNYRTIIVINQEIYTKIELYRQFLEKSEFKSCLDRAIFLRDDSVEEIPSTELNTVENFVYLFGTINKEQYEAHYNSIEEKRKKYQNAVHYMLFCRDECQEEAYDESEGADPFVHKTYALGILGEDLETDADEAGLTDDLNCLKLLALAMAICRFNEGKGDAHFESYYMCVNVKLDYKNIFYAIMHSLSKEADLINEKEREIKMNEEMVSLLKKKKANKCEGNYGDVDTADTETGLKSKFSDYKNISTLQRDMEVAFKIGSESLEQSISKKIDVARCALAIEEEFKPEFRLTTEDGKVELELVENAKYFQNYMSITEVEKEKEAQEVAQPADLLKKPVLEENPDFIQFRALVPLAKDFDENRKFKPWVTLLAGLCFAVLFALISGLVYFVRYITMGLVGVAWSDVVKTLAIPAAGLLLTGVAGLLIYLIRYLICKSIFKNVYKGLKKFLDSRKDISNKIKEYINKYLTVYYNYHIKHSRIEKLHEENAVLENEIKIIKGKVTPINDVADTICLLNGGDIEIPKLVPDEADGEEALSMKKQLEKSVEITTVVNCSDGAIKTVTPWASEISYGVGNLNSEGGR